MYEENHVRNDGQYFERIIEMIEEILSAVNKTSREEMKVTKGLALIIVVGSFLIGLIIGNACGCGHTKKVMKKKAAPQEDFDADEYVKSLNFDEDF